MEALISTAKVQLANERRLMVAGKGNSVVVSEHGPASLHIVETLLKILEAQAAEIEELRRQPARAG